MWRALDDELDPLARVIRLMIMTGARRGEVEAMTWDELDKDRTVWTLPAARSKNKLAHTVALSWQARDLLPPRNAGTFVFSHRRRQDASSQAFGASEDPGSTRS